ncbi:MAG TPA: protein-L-isoaspartate(D-aspartate) O-methyltransferase [Vicinamibacterales bacterium]|jgi:protein-L-isoaspartate(D-aspartate) O-methyltransferase
MRPASSIRLGVTIILAGSCVTADDAQRDRQAAEWTEARARMVRTQLRGRDIHDERVLDAMSKVERHRFIPASVRHDAYGDFPLPIGDGQTISQPYIVAFMTQALAIEPQHRVLEIGTGSGYQAAILAELAKEVYTIEILPQLGDQARATLEALGYRNVHVLIGNGYLGWPEHAPFDRIIVTAAPAEIPRALIDQLRDGGRMAIPVGRDDQELRILERAGDRVNVLQTLPVRFVPMVDKK